MPESSKWDYRASVNKSGSAGVLKAAKDIASSRLAQITSPHAFDAGQSQAECRALSSRKCN